MTPLPYFKKFRKKKLLKKDPNIFRVDMHVHTCFSNDSTKIRFIDIAFNPLGKPDEIYESCIKKGMNAVTFTDHNTIDGCKNFLDNHPKLYNKTFFFGAEVFAHIKNAPNFHIELNVYKFTEKQFEEFMKLKDNVFELIDYLNQNGIPFQYNHPYWYVHYYKKYNKFINQIAEKANVIETINSHRSRISNNLAKNLALTLNKGKSGGSDTHAFNTTMAFTSAKAKNLHEFFQKYQNGQTWAEGRSRRFQSFWDESIGIFNTEWKRIFTNANSSRTKAVIYSIMKAPVKYIFKGVIKTYTMLGD
jgi:predicted metal-dependent phosphoesterase TrpH